MNLRNFIIVLTALLLAACGRPFGTTSSADENVVESEADREQPGGDKANGAGGVATDGDDSLGAEEGVNNQQDAPVGPGGGRAATTADFAFDAYTVAGADGRSSVVAPHGLARSLVVAHAAVEAAQADQITTLLQPYLGYDPLYDAFNTQDLELESREDSGAFDMLGAVWAHEDVAVEQDFVDTLARYVGLNLRLVDFEAAPADARATINNWYTEQTDGRLSDVVGPEGVEATTRFLITDATWFSARWSFGGFDPARTDYETFFGTESEVQLPMMHGDATLFRVAGSDFDAVVLPMDGQFSMVAVLPDDLTTFEQSLESDFVDRLVNEAEATPVALSFPRLEVSDRVRLSSVAEELGVSGLFDAETEYPAFADETMLHDAHQRTRVSFDEEGVEAFAANDDGADIDPAPAPPEDEMVELRFDRPFFFAIRDNQTGTLLFLGRVAQP